MPGRVSQHEEEIINHLSWSLLGSGSLQLHAKLLGLYQRSCKLWMGRMMSLCCNVIPWWAGKTLCPILHGDKRNESPHIPAQLAFSFPYSQAVNYPEIKTWIRSFFCQDPLSHSCGAARSFPSFMLAGAATAGAATPPSFFGWIQWEMPCSTALAVEVLQVACKALQLAPQGLSLWFIVPLIITIYLLLQHINRAAVYQVYAGHEIIDYRCAEHWKRRKEVSVKSPDLTHIWIFPEAVWYLLFAVCKQQ